MAQDRMTVAEAKTFHYSAANHTKVLTAIAAKVVPCGCVPYTDVFNYRRWQAQGMQVQRGEKMLVKLPTIYMTDSDGQESKRMGSSAVFCRCQVKDVVV